jgi:hypothetical protein
VRRTRIRTHAVPKVKLNADGKPREAFEGLRIEDYREWIRACPCVVNDAMRCIYAEHQSDAAHVESKARGSGDAGNLVAMCRRHHREQHDYGMKDFQRTYGVNLRQLAGAFWLRYEESKGLPTL